MSNSKSDDLPLVTVIVGCFNHSRFVEECLDSVRAQTYSNLQWIIFDDCSSDDSTEVIRAWMRRNGVDAKFIAHPKNVGLCRSLNEAIQLAQGKYISLLAADDAWMPFKIEAQVAMIERLPDRVGVVYSDAYQMDEGGRTLSGMFIESHRAPDFMPAGDIHDFVWQGNFIPAMTTLIRKRCFDEVGLYDEEFIYEDWDMWLRISAKFEFACYERPTARYRIVATSIMRSKTELMKDSTSRMFIKYLECGRVPDRFRTGAVDVLCEYSAGLYRKGDPRGRHYLWRALRYRPSVRRLLALLMCAVGIPAPPAALTGVSRPPSSGANSAQ